MKIKKGDKVFIIKGKDRGKTSTVIKALPKDNKIIVEGVALHKKHMRPRKEGQKGQRVEKPSPIQMANVMLYCSSCSKPTRAGFKIEGDKKVRFCKKCQSVL